jgi:hypothetical protein
MQVWVVVHIERLQLLQGADLLQIGFREVLVNSDLTSGRKDR